MPGKMYSVRSLSFRENLHFINHLRPSSPFLCKFRLDENCHHFESVTERRLPRLGTNTMPRSDCGMVVKSCRRTIPQSLNRVDY
jgi:hypothetical protein